MSALLLFKQAGLEDQIKVGFDINSLLAQAKSSFQGAGETLGRYGRNGLLGAGVGAAGMGLASMMGGEDGESPEEKRSRILGNILKGTALGGAAGLGGTAFYDQFLGDKLAPNIQAHKDALAKRRPDIAFDPNPRSHNHPYASGLIAATHQPGGVDAAIGGAGGMGLHALKQRASGKAFEELAKGDYGNAQGVDRLKAMAGARSWEDPMMKKRLLERLVRSGEGAASPVDVAEMADKLKINPIHAGPLANNLHNISQASGGGYAPIPGEFTQQFPRLGGALNSAKAGVVNGLGRVGIDPFMLKNLKNYSKAGLVGAGLTIGGTAALGGMTDAVQKFKYPHEQLKAWNEMGR